MTGQPHKQALIFNYLITKGKKGLRQHVKAVCLGAFHWGTGIENQGSRIRRIGVSYRNSPQ